MATQSLGIGPDSRTFLNGGVFATVAGSLWLAVIRYDVLTRRPGTSRLGFRSVVTEMNEPVFVVNNDSTVVNANATAQSLFDPDVVGTEFNDVLGQSVTELRDSNIVEHRTLEGYRQFDPRISIGLWGANWAVQSLGGRLIFGKSHLGGAEVRIEVPIFEK